MGGLINAWQQSGGRSCRPSSAARYRTSFPRNIVSYLLQRAVEAVWAVVQMLSGVLSVRTRREAVPAKGTACAPCAGASAANASGRTLIATSRPSCSSRAVDLTHPALNSLIIHMLVIRRRNSLHTRYAVLVLSGIQDGFFVRLTSNPGFVDSAHVRGDNSPTFRESSPSLHLTADPTGLVGSIG